LIYIQRFEVSKSKGKSKKAKVKSDEFWILAVGSWLFVVCLWSLVFVYCSKPKADFVQKLKAKS
jgi:hypothetical protein